MTKAKPATRPMPISSVTGRIVSQQYATTHPNTTVVLRVPVRKPGKTK